MYGEKNLSGYLIFKMAERKMRAMLKDRKLCSCGGSRLGHDMV